MRNTGSRITLGALPAHAGRAVRRQVLFIMAAGLGVGAVGGERAAGEQIKWVGYQFGPPGGLPFLFDAASFFHGTQWFNFNVPGANDEAFFDVEFDPQENGMPHHVYFGDYNVPPVPLYNPNGTFIPGGDATVLRLGIHGGHFTFHFTDDTGTPQGGLTVLDTLLVSDVQSVSLTLLKGTVTADYAALFSSGGTATLTLDDATLATKPTGLLDVGIQGQRGALYVAGNSLLETGYLRVGENQGSNGLLQISGSQARAKTNGGQVGATGTGGVVIRQGGSWESSSTLRLANFGGSAKGDVLVTDAGSMLRVDQHLLVGDTGTGSLEVSDGARAVVAWDVFVGNTGNGTLLIDSGGQVQSRGGLLAPEGGATADVRVINPGSLWTLQYLSVGRDGTATVKASGRGTVHSTQTIEVGPNGTLDFASDGRVLVGGGDPAAVTPGTMLVAPGGRLAGSGTLVGNVFVDGGTLAPGTSPGALHVTGNLRMLPGSRLLMEVAGLLPGAQYDQVLVSGDLVLAGVQVDVLFLDGFIPMVGDAFDLFSSGGVFGPPQVVNFLNAPPGFDYSTGFQDGVFSVTVTAVPEASSALVALLASAIATARERRNRRPRREAKRGRSD